MPAQKGAFHIADEWWFVQQKEITRKLEDPKVERLTAKRTLYYFKDFINE